MCAMGGGAVVGGDGVKTGGGDKVVRGGSCRIGVSVCAIFAAEEDAGDRGASDRGHKGDSDGGSDGSSAGDESGEGMADEETISTRWTPLSARGRRRTTLMLAAKPKVAHQRRRARLSRLPLLVRGESGGEEGGNSE